MDYDVVVCGEALIDQFLHFNPDESGKPAVYATLVTGGSPKNTATTLANLGTPTALVARIADDPLGNWIREELIASGVYTGLCIQSDEPTTIAMIPPPTVGEGPGYYFYANADRGWSIEQLPSSFGGIRACIVAGSLALAIESMAATLEHIMRRESDRLVVFDPNIRVNLIAQTQPAHIEERLDRWVSLSTIVKASDEDVNWRHPGEPLEAVAERWLTRGPSLVAITKGAEPGLIMTPGHLLPIPITPVPHNPLKPAGDAVGCGDAFTGGLVDWLLRHNIDSADAIDHMSEQQLTAAAQWASAVAALTYAEQGALPPERDAVVRLIDSLASHEVL